LQKIAVDHTGRDMTGAAMMVRIKEHWPSGMGLDPERLLAGNAAPLIEATASPIRE
jgi:hypothetical protein